MAEHSWFEGFRWITLTCGSGRGCGQQLGWAFDKPGGTSRFHGLIVDKVRIVPVAEEEAMFGVAIVSP